MSQNLIVIPTTGTLSGLALAQAVNAALDSIDSLHSGAADPGAIGAYRLWADVTTGILKQRNAANIGWISLRSLSTGFPVGAAAAGLNGDITGLTGLVGPGLVPIGSVMYVAFSSSAPAGYLKANGALVSRSTYAALFAAIGTTFGAGDGSTTFSIPDGRGEFIRGWDDGRGVDSGRGFGSAQGFSVEAHAHGSSALAGANSRPVGGGSSESATAGSSTGSYGGSETRPRNLALLAIIKY